MEKEIVVIHDWNNLAFRLAFLPEFNIKDFRTKEEIENNVPRAEPDYNGWFFALFMNVYLSIFKNEPCHEIIIATDDKISWRKYFWTRYKESRDGKKDKSVNWDEFYFKLNEIKSAFKQFVPFKMLSVKNAEGDDIIGWICNNGPDKYHYNVISTDKDFKQLCKENISVYNPIKKETYTYENVDVEDFLQEQFVCGQAKDDIFNVLTPIDWPTNQRKPGMGPKTYQKVKEYGIIKWLQDNNSKYQKPFISPQNLVENYNRNRALIDLSLIPPSICSRIQRAYHEYKLPNPDYMYKLFEKYEWNMDEWDKVESNLLRLY